MAKQEEIQSNWDVFKHGASKEGSINVTLANAELICRWGIIITTVVFYLIMVGTIVLDKAHFIDSGKDLLLGNADVEILVGGVAFPLMFAQIFSGAIRYYLSDRSQETRSRIERELILSIMLVIFMLISWSMIYASVSLLSR